MKYRKTISLCLFVTFSAALSCQSIQNGRVKLLLKDRLTDSPIANTKLCAALNSDTLVSTTDSEGYCILDGIKPSKYSLYVHSDGYRGLLLTVLMIGDGKTSYPTFTLDPNRELTKKEKKYLRHR